LNPVTVYLLLVVFLATLIRSAFGFGEALVAVPLLALRVPIAVAAPLAVLLSITIAAVVVVQDWRHVHFRSAIWLVLATIPGIPIGLWLLKAANERVVDAILAAVIIVFSAYSLLTPRPPRLAGEQRGATMGFGFAAGVLGGAYGMNGPPLVIYGALRRWSAPHLRATLQAYFLPASLLGLAGYWAGGLLGRKVLLDYLLCLPAALIAIPLGRLINRRLHGRAFLFYIHLGLILVGLTLLLDALHG
jgi:uncharacterized membrane protein YfcA